MIGKKSNLKHKFAENTNKTNVNLTGRSIPMTAVKLFFFNEIVGDTIFLLQKFYCFIFMCILLLTFISHSITQKIPTSGSLLHNLIKHYIVFLFIRLLCFKCLENQTKWPTFYGFPVSKDEYFIFIYLIHKKNDQHT